jgi:CRISPR/Cas system-associated exonuclease Cas4 (RecB family)
MKLANNPPPTTSEPFRLSVSSVRLYQSCPRKFAYRYCDGIEANKEPDDDLRFGTAFHAALEDNYDRPAAEWSVAEACKGLDADSAALLGGTVAAYAAHWAGSLTYRYKELPIVTGMRSPRLEMLAILDGIATTARGDLAVVEHKTTRSDIRPGSHYWERTTLDLQAATYLWVARDYGLPVAHVEWDAIARPRLTRRADAVAPEHYVRDGKWGKAGDVKPGTGIPAELPLEYAGRVKSTLLADPGAYFQRHPVVLLEAELDAARRDVDAVGAQILTSWDTSTWPRNTSTCMSWGKRCEFWDVCTGAASPADEQLFRLRRSRDAP